MGAYRRRSVREPGHRGSEEGPKTEQEIQPFFPFGDVDERRNG